MQSHPIVAVDLGGTVEDSWADKRSWFSKIGIDIGNIPRGRQDVIKMIGGNPQLYEQMANEVYSDTSILKHAPIHGAGEALRALRARFTIVALSTRKADQENVTREWLRCHYLTDCLSELVLIGDVMASRPNYKIAWCAENNAHALIDDDAEHLGYCNSRVSLMRIHLCLHSTTDAFASEQAPQIHLAMDWREVVRILFRGVNQ